MTRQRVIRAIASAAIALTTKGQSLLFLVALLAYGSQSDLIRYGQYTSMQMLIGYVLFCSTPFAHGRLIFTGADTREYRYIPISACLLLLQSAALLLISLTAQALLNPTSTIVSLLNTPTICSIILYLASEHFVTTARSTGNSHYLGLTGAVRLSSAAVLFGLGVQTKSITFNQFLLSVSMASLLITAIGCVIFAKRYRLLREIRNFWRDSHLTFKTAAFSFSLSFVPLCIWIQNLSGRLIINPQAPSAAGYTIYSFAATNASIVTLIIFDSMRSSIYNVASDHIPSQWIRTFRMTALASLSAFALYGVVVVAAVYFYISAYGMSFDIQWYTFLPISIALTFLSGVSEWLCVSVRKLKILNLAMALSTLFFVGYLLVERMLTTNDTGTALIISSILSSLIFSSACFLGNFPLVRQLIGAESSQPSPSAKLKL